MKPNTELFEGMPEDERESEWRGMPEFDQPENGAVRQIIVSFSQHSDVEEFARLVGQNITKKTKSIWFPNREKNNVVDLFYVAEGNPLGGSKDES